MKGGYKYNDVKKDATDATKDADDLPINGWEIKLYADADDNGVPDGAALATALTGAGDWADGYYEFPGLDPGKYLVSESQTFDGKTYQMRMAKMQRVAEGQEHA